MSAPEKRNLLQAVRDASGKAQQAVAPEAAAPYIAPSRQGLRAKTFFLQPAAVKQLKTTAVEMGRSEQDILREALNDWFAKHGLPELG